MKTIELHPVLQQIVEALPDHFREVIADPRDPNYLNLSYAGWAEPLIYDKVEGVMFHPRHGRSRRYPIRKDGTINAAKLAEVATALYDKEAEWHRQYDEEQRKRDAESRQAEINFEAISKKLRLGRRYRRGKEGEHITYVGGCHLIHKKSDTRGEIWSDGEDRVKGKIPFAGLDVPTFNAIMAILNGHEFRILDEKRS